MTEETIATPSSDLPDQARPTRHAAQAGLLATTAFLVEVLVTQAPALRGADAWDRIGGAVVRSNLLVFFEIVLVLAPFAYYLLASARLLPRVQRITAVLLGLFLLVHFWELPLQHASFGLAADAMLTRMTELFSRTWAGIPLLALLHIVGIGLACFHFALGLLAIGRPRALATVLGAVLFVVGSGSVIGIATGASFVPAPSLPDAACGTAVDKPAH